MYGNCMLNITVCVRMDFCTDLTCNRFKPVFQYVIPNGLCTCVSNHFCTANFYERMYLHGVCLLHNNDYVCVRLFVTQVMYGVSVYERMYLCSICLLHLTGYVRRVFLNVCIYVISVCFI